ncbi:MAG: transporter [Thermodesulfobacteriota bacterium]
MKKVYVLLTVVFLALPAAAHAYIGLCCGKCGGNMPMNIMGGGVPETKEFRLKISPMFMKMGDLRDGTHSVDEDSLITGMGAPYMAVPTEMTMTMTNLAVGYSFTDDFFVGIMPMWKKNRMRMKVQPMMGAPYKYTMESDGMADTMLMTKYRLYADDPLIPTNQFSFFFGLSLPTGSIDEENDEHPDPAKRDALLPYGMQLGSGTFDPSFGLLYQGSSSPWWWGANLTYTGRWYKNKREYRLGDELKLDLYGMYQLRYDLVGQLQLNAKSSGKVRGEMDDARDGLAGRMMNGNYMSPMWDPDNYGGEKLSATVGLQWQPFPLHILDVNVGVPIYEDLNGPQMEEDYRVMLTWYIEIPTKASRRYVPKPAKSRLGF